jgi:tetratricopeptide (TPR) repeat protein
MTQVDHASDGSPSFDLVAKGLVELHRLIKEGQGDSPEAELVRDSMDGPMKALNPIETERARWLSEDLYTISEPKTSTSEPAMDSASQRRLNEAFEARENRILDRSLELFRALQDQISLDLLSYNRGLIWEEAGYPAVAAIFFEHAYAIDPSNAHYQELYIHSLAESEPLAGDFLARRILADDLNHDPLVVAQAASIRLRRTTYASDSEAIQSIRDLIPILERNLARIEKNPANPTERAAYESIVGKLGILNELLGNSGAAVEYFTRGLRMNPNNDGLLAARGVLLYGTNPSAIADFERAVQLGAQFAWPFLFLAHHYLATGRFEECLATSQAGLRMRGSLAAKSQLEEWAAISRAELGFPAEYVRSAFEAAIRLDPSNDVARRNLDSFEASLGPSGQRLRTKWERRSEATIRQFGLAERRYGVAA